jgi:hypothetical protein
VASQSVIGAPESKSCMVRAACRVFVWASVVYVVVAASSDATAQPGVDPVDDRQVVFPDASAVPKCCVPPRDYAARTNFVPALFRSVEGL